MLPDASAPVCAGPYGSKIWESAKDERIPFLKNDGESNTGWQKILISRQSRFPRQAR
jgi:hypothetical protein